MDSGGHTELVLLVLLTAITGLVVLAWLTRVPYPIFLVVGGLILGFVPGVPEVELDPEMVLVVFLPPLLYAAAFFSSLRDLRANLKPIGGLAVALVLATMAAVAVAAHEVIGLSWETSFVLGAIVSPTDPVAAVAIARRLGVPRRVVTIIEGEALINDGTALVAYRVAVAAVVSGSFSLWEAGLSFVVNGVGGVALGLAVAWLVRQLRRRIEDAPTEITISLVTPYVAYLPAEMLGVSGVLAAVTTGIYLGWYAPQLVSPSTRVQAYAVWESLQFVLNALLFALIGLQLPHILDDLSETSTGTLIGYAAVVSGVVILVRLAFVFGFAYIPRIPHRHEPSPFPNWRPVLLVGWTGLRGAVSLAAALAIPLETDAGAAFPERALIVYLVFTVILATLVLQGLSLPLLIKTMDVDEDGGAAWEEDKARMKAAEAGIARLETLASEDWVREDTAERLRGMLDYRRRRFAARFEDGDDGGIEERSAAYQRLLREVLDAQRQSVVELRNRGVINDEVMRRVERDLDLEDLRLE